MRGRATVRGLLAVAVAALAAGCAAEAAGVGTPAGAWVASSTETARSCSAFAGIRPFAGGELLIGEGGGFRWRPAIGVDVPYKAVGNRTYRRAITTVYGGCQIRADAYFKLGPVTSGKLQGTYEVTYTRKTASERCQAVPDVCELRWDVVGEKPDPNRLARR